jgi:WD40 repeat protein
MRFQPAPFRIERQWPAMLLRALVCSLAFVVALTAVVGVIFEIYVGSSFRNAGNTAIIHCAATGTDGQAVVLSRTVFGNEQRTQYRLWLYESDSAHLTAFMPHMHSSPSCLASIRGSQQIVIGGWDGSIYLADVTKPDEQPFLLGRHLDGGTMSLQCSPSGKYLASRTAFWLRAWDLTSCQLIWEQAAQEMTCHAIDPESRRVVSGRYDGYIEEWNLETGALVRAAANPQCEGAICDVDFHVDGRLLATISKGFARGEAHLLRWPPDDGTWSAGGSPWRCGWARRSTFSPDGAYLVTTSEDSKYLLDVWDVRSRKRLGTLEGHQQFVLGTAFSSDRRLFSWSADGTIRVWDVTRQRLLGVIEPPT